MHEFSLETIGFYAAVWAIAFVAAFSRTIRDDEFRSLGYGISLGATAGLFSFGAIALLVDGTADSGDRPFYYLGIAALIGLLAKEQDKWARTLLTRVFVAARMVLPAEERSDEIPTRRVSEGHEAPHDIPTRRVSEGHGHEPEAKQ